MPTKIKISTSQGDIEFLLKEDKAPITVANILQYVDDKFYDGSVFHRVIDGFMVQGGGLNANLERLERRAPIKNEWTNGLKNVRGSVAMARPGGDPDSATSQFFINLVDNDSLDEAADDGAGYCVFAEVSAGMDVVDKIAALPVTTKGDYRNCPVETVHIHSVRRV